MTCQAAVTSVLERTKAKYIEPAKFDILTALRSFPDLTPDSENFTFPDNSRSLTFRLKGTIPVLYKGNTYNIPVALYLWDSHPYYPPVCYVCPTSTMMVKESKTVDKHGRIYLPYLADWRFPGYDLCGLLQVMVMCFQENCPVFSKPTRPAGRPLNASPSSSQPVYTPYPISTPAGMPPYPINSPSVTHFTPHHSPYPAGFQSTPPAPGSTIEPQHLKASILSAVEDKVRQRLREKLGTLYAELASIRQTQSELHAGKEKLRAISSELLNEQKKLEAALIAYQEKKAQISSVLSSYKSDSSFEIDSVIDASTPLHKQLLRCYVYDCAIDDAIYLLGQALKNGRIALGNYLKEVRQLSRKQFIYRATLQKCRIKAKLPV